MLKELPKSELIIKLMVRKEKFNKCRTIYGKISPEDLIEEDEQIDTYISNIVNPETTVITNEETTSYESEELEEELVPVPVVNKEEDAQNKEHTKTYTEQFKRGYFGKRKRF